MSKKSAKRPLQPQRSAKAKRPFLGFQSWLDRPSIATPRDPFYKKIFLGAGIAVLLLTIVLALGSGINGDDEYQNDYSAKLVNYYATMGADTAALNIPKGNMHYYGGFFDIVTGFTNKAFGYTWTDAGYHKVRHVLNAVFGFLAMLFTALLAKEIAGWRAGILVLVLMFLSPRFLGHSLMNPKDIPFAAGYAIALFYMVRLFSLLPALGKATWKAASGVALGMALAIATRAGGLILVGILGLYAGLDFLIKNGFSGLAKQGKTLGKYAALAAGISVAGFVLALLFWPYALQSPLTHPFEALGEFSKLGVKIRVLFQGENIMSDKTPWYYALDWIWRTIPLFTLVGFAGSIVLLPSIFRRYSVLPVFMTLFAAVFPVFYIIVKNSILHDGWRHLLFVYPGMVVMAALFWLRLEEIFLAKNKVAVYGLAALLGLMALESAMFIARNPHYPYVYFNCVSGGMKGAFGRFETDYWGLSMKQAIEWLEKQGILKPGMTQTVTIATSFSYVAHAYLDKPYGNKVNILYQRFNNRYDNAWDYGIFPSRYIKGPHLRAGTWPNSRSIHQVTANGVPLLSIEKGSGAIFEAEKNFKAGDFQAAIDGYLSETQQHPDNEIAWNKLAMAYANLGNFQEARNAADQLLKVAPDHTNGLLYRGVAAMNLGDAASAEQDLRRAIAVEDDFATAYYYLALLQSNRNDLSSALDNLQKAIEAAPGFKAAYELAAQLYDRQGNAQRAQQIREAASKL